MLGRPARDQGRLVVSPVHITWTPLIVRERVPPDARPPAVSCTLHPNDPDVDPIKAYPACRRHLFTAPPWNSGDMSIGDLPAADVRMTDVSAKGDDPAAIGRRMNSS